MLLRKHIWIGLVMLLLLVLLILVTVMYWQHVTGTNLLHLLAVDPTHGC